MALACFKKQRTQQDQACRFFALGFRCLTGDMANSTPHDVDTNALIELGVLLQSTVGAFHNLTMMQISSSPLLHEVIGTANDSRVKAFYDKAFGAETGVDELPEIMA